MAPGTFSTPYFPKDDGEPVTNEGFACNTLSSCLAGIIYLFTVGFGSAMAYAATWMFSISVALSLHSTAYALGFLSGAWETVRDIANMFFILILVYIAFTIMFRAETTDTMKRLAWVVVIALLINFSFFFVRVVIDAGNLLAVQFYNAIVVDAPVLGASGNSDLDAVTGQVSPGPTAAGTAETKDLTASIMDAIGIYTLLSNDSFKKFQESNNAGILGSWQELIALSFIYIAVGIMFFMLAAAFFAVAIKFLIRMVILWVVLFTSPLAFVANTFEQGRKAYQFWQNALVQHTFYPAVFLFLFYILTMLMDELRAGDTLIGQAFSGSAQFANLTGLTYTVAVVAILFVYLAIVLILLYIALKASDKMGIMGKDAANGFARWATRMGSNVMYGGAAFVGQRTIGRAAQEAYAGRNAAQRNTLWGRSLNTLRQGSFDLRGIRGAGGVRTALRDTNYGLGGIEYDIGRAERFRREPPPDPQTGSQAAAPPQQTNAPQQNTTQQTSQQPLSGQIIPPGQPGGPRPRPGFGPRGEVYGQPPQEPAGALPHPRSFPPMAHAELDAVRVDIGKIFKDMRKETRAASQSQREAAEAVKNLGDKLRKSSEGGSKRMEQAAEALQSRLEVVTPQAAKPMPPQFKPGGGVTPMTQEEMDSARKNTN